MFLYIVTLSVTEGVFISTIAVIFIDRCVKYKWVYVH